ncbi:MAG: hypothetical protein CO186_12800 [Zetaproteobacteria bacterium CG_4_9_14_3_um_filter_49_83]|nr:MAG: hypothetical protein AUJ56_07765 [Zetaproteobacteria bacterium CG1_02_49_23]PIQ32793.1 MAG: hypothetical protein COW62_06740 [Zetaproteobacteria bacterium CG17_big_fil_post_rev_8_21_14_2_50_50_13]PIV29861.1 MAG: hypothetical protein COS35_09730 [Zetaproteobacteria bacterium CG02_land_8_20_14_3_00_50_9]PIY56670.1 MAG: hypothetical protein COZ00_02970 [Zetaproteobacteria bacterium CG_4_10_14_0_8_um_filter_49_80]PJA33759.1 MAG: hypothetical protein CO186_12800 [Zetaproteobacteria bacterium
MTTSTTNSTAASDESPFEFPCTFPLKVMGMNSDSFEVDMVMIVRKYCPDFFEGAVKSRPSRTGKYVSVTITFAASSREQLDHIYREAHRHPDFKMAL